MSHPEPTRRVRRRGPVTRVLDLFSSIWFGVFLLFLLFVYSSIGSAGLPIAEGVLSYPFFLRPDAWVSIRELWEISEFEWFHWWPFDALIALICVTLVTATLRRIPFSRVNLGVWMIHTGIIVLALGSVWYFGTKVEGDAPVARRQVVATVPGHEPVTMLAMPGNRVQVGRGADAYLLSISGITPDWELLSGDDAGRRTYKVSVLAQHPGGAFVRELLAGFPQYTEDLVQSDDPQQPFARAKKVLGTPLVDETLSLKLEYAPQSRFYVRETAAIYLREQGTREWIERPVRTRPRFAEWLEHPMRRLPRFKDHVASYDEVWTAPGADLPPLRPLDVAVPAVDERDPLPDVTLRISDYLRYASMQSQRRPGGERLDPAISIRLFDDRGRSEHFDMEALDPQTNSLGGGVVRFDWITSPAQLEALRAVRPSTLGITLVAEGIEREDPIPSVAGDQAGPAFTPIEGSDYAYRVTGVQDELVIGERTVSVAVVEIARGEQTITRWVFDDPALTRDLTPGDDAGAQVSDELIDSNIRITYRPGQRGGLRIVGGPGDEDLRLLIPTDAGGFAEEALRLREPVELRPGTFLALTDFVVRPRVETRPLLVPLHQRDRDLGVQASMVRVHVPAGGAVQSRWLSYHHYPFAGPEEVFLRFPYEPSVVHLPDGRHVEIMFSRERRPLPDPVALDDFRLTTHIGGYGGSNASIRDWTSVVRFAEAEAWSEPELVSVNAPKEHDGFWFFQSQWDPPIAPRRAGETGSPGLNYTVLGVGNRRGVVTQLAGCCIAVLGMIYAFYVKPVIKRRRQQAVYAQARSARTARAPEPVGTGASARGEDIA